MPRNWMWIAAALMLGAIAVQSGCAVSEAVSLEAPDKPAAMPNVVIILADDLGWRDVSANGAEFATPNIDRLLAQGVSFNRFYTQPLCTPTRAGLLTGQHAVRFGLNRSVIWGGSDAGLPDEVLTLPERLGIAGYERRAIVGKWHLGHVRRAYHPMRHGFTDFLGLYNGRIDYFTQEVGGERDWHRGYEPTSERGYTTEQITNEATRIIRAEAGKKPFFLYVAYTSPHQPNQPRPRDLAAVSHIKGEARGKHAGLVTNLDEGIGHIRAALEATGISRDTLLIFLTDNGGATTYGGANAPLRDGKGTVYEGGVRVPMAMYWPNGGVSGGRTLASIAASTDVAPTVLAAAGLPSDPTLDGLDLLPALRGAEQTGGSPREILVRTGDRATIQTAVITQDWKYVEIDSPGATPGQAPKRQQFLFKIAEDPVESKDVLAAHPEIAVQLAASAARFAALEPKPGTLRTALDPSEFGANPPGDVAPKDWAIPPD